MQARTAILSLAMTVGALACSSHRSFQGMSSAAGGGAGGSRAGTGGTHGGRSSGASGGVPSSEGGAPGEGGAPNAGSSEGGSGDVPSGCPQQYRCEANVLERCTGAGEWVTEAACDPPNAVCNARAHSCLNVVLSGSIVGLGVASPPASGPRLSDGRLLLAPMLCNSAKTACVRGGFLP